MLCLEKIDTMLVVLLGVFVDSSGDDTEIERSDEIDIMRYEIERNYEHNRNLDFVSFLCRLYLKIKIKINV